MEKKFWGNMPAYKHLCNYAAQKYPGPLILVGKQGLGKRIAAFSLAASLLGCSEEILSQNRDFLLIDKRKDPIKVEDILELLEQSNLASLGNRKVYLICQAENINVQAQNKLLKLLEDRNLKNTVIFVCNQDVLLDTIKSRCMTINFSPLAQNEMEEYLNNCKVEKDCDFIMNLCDNCPYHLEEALEIYPDLKNLFQNILSIKQREDLLSVFHLIKEKDPMEFYSTYYTNHFSMGLLMLQYLFYNLLMAHLYNVPSEIKSIYDNLLSLYSIKDTYQICIAITSHHRQWLSGVYTKNDFFDLVRVMI